MGPERVKPVRLGRARSFNTKILAEIKGFVKTFIIMDNWR